MGLISTYDIRLWMGAEDGDKKINPKLGAIAQAIQAFVETTTNRKLEAKHYQNDPYFSYLDGRGKRFFYLPQYPVSYLSEVNVDPNRTWGSGTIVNSNDYFWYPTGKVEANAVYFYPNSNNGYFFIGKRIIKVDYIAGYAPVVGGTYDSTVSSYPFPADLKQVMVEMCVESIKEGMTGIHTVQGGGQTPDHFTKMLSANSFWMNTIVSYKSFDSQFTFDDEENPEGNPGLGWGWGHFR